MKIAFFVLIANVTLFAAASPAQTRPVQNAGPSCGSLLDQLLRCPRFGFTYKVKLGWVDRTADMNADAQSSPDDSNQDENAETNKGVQQPASSSGAETLLAVFERPPGAQGDTIDSAVVIAAEPLANYHGVKTAVEYFGAITELAEQRGFKVENGPYSFSVGAKQLVRGEFTKDRNKLAMWQTSMAMIEKGYIVSFTFIGGSEDEVNDLISNLSFSPRSRQSTPAPK